MNTFFYRDHFFGAFNTNDNSVTLEVQGTGEALIYWGDGPRDHLSLPASISHSYVDNSLKTIRVYTWDKTTITGIKLINSSVSDIEYDTDWINQAVILNLGGNELDANNIVTRVQTDNSSTSTREINLFGSPISPLSSEEIDDIEELSTSSNLTFYFSPQGLNTYEDA